MDDKELEKGFNRAKVALMTLHNSAFICTILFSLRHAWDDKVPTAQTDGANLTINPNWFMDLNPKQRIALLAHEAWHVAFDHVTRGQYLNKKKYNVAADYVINIMLKDNNYELPEGGCVDSQYRGMSTEEVYKLLPDPPEDFQGDLVDPYGEGMSDADKAQIQQNIQQILTKASQKSKMDGDDPGTIPGDIARMINELTNPKLNWFTILQNYMTAFDKTDYSFRKPNRRFFPDYYLPGLHGESMGELALAFDASGSVSPEEFSLYFGETKYMRDNLKPTKTTILEFDTQINNVYELSKEDTMDDVKFTGGGGTDLTPVFKYFEKHGAPTILIVFSDFWCSKIQKDPGYPVVWISVNNPNAEVNFGTLIHYDLVFDQ